MLTQLATQFISVSQIHPDPSQPRRDFDPVKLEQLKCSIANNGLLHPILVRFDRARGTYVLIAGERRWRCFVELAIDDIPARVIEGDLTPEETLQVQIIENVQRDDLNPMEEARSLQRLQALLKCTRDDLAIHVQRSPASISRSFKLLELPSDIQRHVETGRMPVSIAAELHRCSSEALQRELADKVVAGQFTRDQVVAAVQDAAGTRSTKRSGTLSIRLPSSVTVTVPSTSSVAECEQAVAWLLKRLRSQRRTSDDLGTVWSAIRADARQSHTAAG